MAHGDAALQQKGADLIDDAGALADQSLAHPAQRLQVELFGGLGRHELHRRPLHSLGDRLGVTKVVLLALGIRPNIFRRHQPGVMAKAVQLAAEMMRADAGFHADQARRHIGKSSFNLATRPFLPQDDRAALVEADDMERVLADIDADDGDLIGGRVGHGRAPSNAAPIQLCSPVGREHGRTIPLAVMGADRELAPHEGICCRQKSPSRLKNPITNQCRFAGFFPGGWFPKGSSAPGRSRCGAVNGVQGEDYHV